jgi:CubicO group peptidase (beta-lactamase class C family)
MRAASILIVLVLATPALTPSAGAQGLAVLNPSGPDAALFGAGENYPARLGGGQDTLVGNYSHFDALTPSRVVAHATPRPLAYVPSELALTYHFDGADRTIADYLARQPVTGLLIARAGTILYEHYQYGRTPADRLTSQSMVKTIVGMLVGIAIGDGAIASVDDPAQRYVPELAGTELGATPIRALLHMASGIAFRETYDGQDDNARLWRLLHRPGNTTAAALASFNTRDAPPDTVWHYAGLNTDLLGLIVARATHHTLADDASEKLWKPMGAEADATWAIDASGQEIGYCCFNATLRDWARLGLLLADGGAAGGRQIIPRDWIQAATSYTADAPFAPNPRRYYGYGYQVWLLPGDRHQFVLIGIHGQMLFVDPATRLVLVQTAVRPRPTGGPGGPELLVLWRALVAALT